MSILFVSVVEHIPYDGCGSFDFGADFHRRFSIGERKIPFIHYGNKFCRQTPTFFFPFPIIPASSPVSRQSIQTKSLGDQRAGIETCSELKSISMVAFFSAEIAYLFTMDSLRQQLRQASQVSLDPFDHSGSVANELNH